VLTASDGIEAIAVYAQHQDEISVVDGHDDAVYGLTTIPLQKKLAPKSRLLLSVG